MSIINPISSKKLAKEFKLPMSTLFFYCRLGIVKPVAMIGKAYIFEKDISCGHLDLVKRQKKKGKTLKEIAKMINSEEVVGDMTVEKVILNEEIKNENNSTTVSAV